MNNKQTLKDSIFKIGKVTSVIGRNVRIKVDKTKNLSHLLYKGEIIKNISVGSYVKITKGFTRIIGKVDGEHTNEEKSFSKEGYVNEKEKINRVLDISLLGFFGERGFEKGIKELPLIDNECFLVDSKEFNDIHHFVTKGDTPITIGTLSLEKGQDINIGINSLFASHIGIFGNTGSGKSYTLAKIYRELFKKYKDEETFKNNAKFLLFDFNGEYASEKCIIEGKKIYNLTTRKSLNDIGIDEKIPFNEDDLIDIELISILASASEKTQQPFLSRALNLHRTIYSAKDSLDFYKNILRKYIVQVLQMTDKGKAHILIDYFINILEKPQQNINEEFLKKIDWNNTYAHFMIRDMSPSRTLREYEMKDNALYDSVNDYQFPENILTKIIHFLYLQLILDIYTDKAQNEHVAPAINKLKSKEKDLNKVLDTNNINGQSSFFDESNIVVLNLKNVSTEMKKFLPLLLSKKIYKEHKEYKEKEEKFLNIIIDEAHNILSAESVREAETWKDYRLETFEEIIKEGRKFGVFLTIASQRPHDISPTIISQLHNYFLHRLINDKDIAAVERTISYLDKLSVEYLSILPTGTCVLAGLLAQVPVIVDIGKIDPKDHEPNNKTINLVKNWKSKIKE